MNKIHLISVSVIVILLLFSSCKRQEPFVDPAYIFLKWSGAVKALNYKDYSECEAFLKIRMFLEIYTGTIIIATSLYVIWGNLMKMI